MTDSEFGKLKVIGVSSIPGSTLAADAGAVIAEYSRRGLNVAANLMQLVRLYEKHSMNVLNNIDWWQRYQPLFTPELKAQFYKYLALL